MFTKDDLKQLQSRGSDLKVVEKQIDNFKKGFPFINLDRPAIVGDGIKAFNQRDAKKLSYYLRLQFETLRGTEICPCFGSSQPYV